MQLLPDKLIVAQLIEKFAAFYAIQIFITVFTRARHWSLPQPDESSPHDLMLPSKGKAQLVWADMDIEYLKAKYLLSSRVNSGTETNPLHFKTN
jgi:hypothetical protein